MISSVFDYVRPIGFCSLLRERNYDAAYDVLNNDYNPNTNDNMGFTALHFCAISDEFYNIAELALEKGACVFHKSHQGATPLHISCFFKSVKITKLLIEHGADINSAIPFQFSPLICVILPSIDHFKFLQYIQNQNQICLESESIEITKLLIDNGANVNFIDFDGLTALHYAVQEKNLNLCNILLKYRINTQCFDSNDRSALHYAITFSDECFKALLPHFDISIYKNGWTYYMEAAQAKKHAILNILLEKDSSSIIAECKIPGYEEKIALHFAISSIDCFTLLLNSTPRKVIEKYCCFNLKRCHIKSLPCLLIEYKNYCGLDVLLSSNLSINVKMCPFVINGELLTPFQFVLYNLVFFKDDVSYIIEIFLKNRIQFQCNYVIESFNSRPIEDFASASNIHIISRTPNLLKLFIKINGNELENIKKLLLLSISRYTDDYVVSFFQIFAVNRCVTVETIFELICSFESNIRNFTQIGLDIGNFLNLNRQWKKYLNINFHKFPNSPKMAILLSNIKAQYDMNDQPWSLIDICIYALRRNLIEISKSASDYRTILKRLFLPKHLYNILK